MQHLATSIDIPAPAGRVWQVLTDFDRYATWNPFIRKISGELRPGARIAADLHLPGHAPMTIRPVLLAVEPGRRLRWKGSILIPGIFDGEHSFEIVPSRDGNSVTLRHEERFSGILVPLVFRSKMREATKQAFEMMNAALKARAESQP